MSAMPKLKLSVEEYIEFDKNNEGKWEYFDGEIVNMAGASLSHNRIVKNILTALERKLEGKGCEALPSDMRIKVPKAWPYRYPDVVVFCGQAVIEKIQGQEMLVNPQLIVEVLSPSTEGVDYGVKFTAYQSIPSFCEYLLVAQDRPYVSHYVRQPNNEWLRRDIDDLDSVVRLVCLNCELTFAEIYRLVDFTAPPTPSQL
jgi:Uma2 family endonuclease